MKSKISLFDRGIAKNFFKRFWVLWAVYLGILIVALPISMMNASANHRPVDVVVLESAVSMVFISAVASAVAVLAVFSFLYDKRSCNMISSMPVRRETVYSTAVISGLLPMLAADLLVFLVVSASNAFAAGGSAQAHISSLVTWLELTVCGNVAFFGIAVFSAMLTGSAWVMPLVYCIFNFSAFIAEVEVQALLSKLIYGYCQSGGKLFFLSPVVHLSEKLYTHSAMSIGGTAIYGIALVWSYCAAGLVLIAFSLLLYRSRSMECAGDTAAFKPLRYIFKYCMTFGTAPLFAIAMYEGFLENIFYGFAEAAVITVLMVMGAFIGYFGAKMLLEKTMNVFRSDWAGFVICACAVIVFCFACEFDVLGIETKIPAAESVEYVEIDNKYYERENIERALSLHKKLIDDKDRQERGYVEKYRIAISYKLKNGSTLQRVYWLEETDDATTDPNSAYSTYAKLQNSDEGRTQRCTMRIPLAKDTFSNVNISYYQIDDSGKYDYDNIYLDLDKALEVYECIREDAENGLIGEYISRNSPEYYTLKTNVDINFETMRSGSDGIRDYDSISFRVQVNSEKTLEWLHANTDIDIQSLFEADPEGCEEALSATKFPSTEAAIGIIGGVDGPTAVVISG